MTWMIIVPCIGDRTMTLKHGGYIFKTVCKIPGKNTHNKLLTC